MSDKVSISPSKSRRQLRERKQRKLYAEEWALGDDDYEGARGFSVAEKLESSRFAQSGMVREMKGSDLSVGFLQQYGFNIPLLFKEKTGLGLQVPSSNFTVNDVRMCVGSRRILDVMDVNTQKNVEMTMKDWEKYYEDPNKKKLLNVISLEFSHTKLENYVQSPNIVRQIDWVDVVWPKQLKESQVESTNVLNEMMYPKVQKYCLMSVKNCFTDFHVDFGGTSVWYHILKGSKVFWLIPPTEKNLQLYEKWVLSGKQSDVFFGDTVEKCARVYLTAGNTFFIPTGWIHAVYTPTDSLVFGGNFLHSFGIVKQLKIAQVEDNTKVPQKFRYPFFTEMLWYVLAKYVYTLLGHSHLEGEPGREAELDGKPHVHLTHYELFGLKEIVMYLYDLPPQKKNVPDLIKDPVALIKDVRTLVERHCKDNPEQAITGAPVLHPDLNKSNNAYLRERYEYYAGDGIKTPGSHEEEGEGSQPSQEENTQDMIPQPQPTEHLVSPSDSPSTAHQMAVTREEQPNSNGTPIAPAIPFNQQQDDDRNFVSPQPTRSAGAGAMRGPYKKNSNNHSGGGGGRSSAEKRDGNGPRRRRTRCKNCEACQRSDCGECSFCLDMVKFGGPGRAKQTCMMRQCLQPMLPVTAQCIHCHLDGWRQAPITAPAQAKLQAQMQEGPSSLMECSVCYEISHPDCAQRLAPEIGGIVNEDLPNSWECPSCCKSGKNTDYRPRHFRARQKSSEIRRMSVSSDASSVHNTEIGRIGGSVIQQPVSSTATTGGVHGTSGGGIGDMAVNTPVAPRFQNDMLYDFTSSGNAVIVGGNGGNVLLERKPKIKNEDMCNGTELDGQKIVMGGPTNVAVKLEIKEEPTESGHGSGIGLKSGDVAAGGHPITNMVMTKRRKSDDGNSMCSSMQDSVEISEHNHSLPRKKSSLRTQLAQQIHSSSTKPMKKPLYPVRPAHVHTPVLSQPGNYALDHTCLLAVFRYLPPETLVTCSLVCKTWSNISVDSSLWKRMNCAEYKLTASLLTGIVRRQPEHLILDWISLGKRQVSWVISRLPGLKHLSIQGTPIQAVLGLHTCMCPPLQILDLSFVAGLNDSAIREILCPPKDSRPGLADSKSRLRNLRVLKLAGTDISDVALRYITQGLPSLTHLDLSSCQRITDAAIAQIGTSSAAIKTLIELDLSCCKLITELSLDHLAKCDALTRLDLSHVPQVTTQAVIKFASTSKNDLQLHDIKLVDKRKTLQ
ncbi:jmjC domain-containing histone demethylation protein 1 isoform X2 [Toxorhynchites rutilus septentrionalis]|uniref:jmjC domain-containing histone demethylation protein 1 isoform X2 n=1 Tax=Toxorhynchites rutilus septentrionalis TaxID=329112 RepID=UPI00247B182B|nr:jmjC domain-containing histone demethylation protein 1 isoform X2 [Toxorhynchites rutilus septentrionalis]